MLHVVVVIGGEALSARAVDTVPGDAIVIAADSGLDHAVAAGLRPSVLVGDLDSISAAGRMWAYAHEIEIHEHPTDKNATDTELALAAAVARPGATHLWLLGGIGDRFDHLLGTLLSLGHPSLASLDEVHAVIGTTHYVVVHGGHTVSLDLEEGQLFSLLALHGKAAGVTSTGARWPLTDATLRPTEARGVSNEAGDPAYGMVTLTVAKGVVTVVVP